MILLGDLNCNLLGNCPDGQALIDLCSTLNLFQLVEKPTRVTETSQRLIDVILTTNKLFIDNCDIMSSTISDHSLVYLTLKLKAQRTRTSYITTRSYKNFDPDNFIEDLSHVLSYKFFRREVKREIRLAEKVHVRSEKYYRPLQTQFSEDDVIDFLASDWWRASSEDLRKIFGKLFGNWRLLIGC